MYLASLVFAFTVFVVMTAYYTKTQAFNVYHPFMYYSLFHGFIFVFRPIIAYISDFNLVYRVYQFNPSVDDKITVILASTIGYIFFAFFCLRSGNEKLVFKNDSAVDLQRVLSAKVFYLSICILSPLAIYSLTTRYGEAMSGYTTMVMDRANGVFMNTVSNGYMTDAQLMLPALAVMIAWIFRFHFLSLLPLLLFVLIRAGTGGRGPFVTACISLGLLWLYSKRRSVFSPRVLLAFVALVTVFDAIGEDRGARIRSIVSDSEKVEVSEYDGKWLEGMDFANMEYFEYLVYVVPQRSGEYGYFIDNLQLFTEPVPRVLWPGKPAGAPFNNIALFDYGFPIGMTRSLPGQGWYSLGWIGVAFWCGLWGGVLGLIYRRWVESDQSIFKTMAYLMFVPSLVVTFRDGTILTAVKQNFWYLGPIAFAAILAHLLNVPKLPAIRHHLRSRRVKGSGSTDRRTAAQREMHKVKLLPPPVARRRAVLAAEREESAFKDIT